MVTGEFEARGVVDTPFGTLAWTGVVEVVGLLLLGGDDDVLPGEDVDVGVDEVCEEVEVGVGEVVSEGWEEEVDCAGEEEVSVDEGVNEDVGVEDVEGGTEVEVGVFDEVSTEGDWEDVGEGVEVGVTDGLTGALR